MNEETSIYYNKKRLIFLLLVSVLCLLLMFWTFINAINLTAEKPNGILIYRWVGIVFYKKPLLLRIVSSLIFLLFSYGLLISIKKLIKKKAKLKNVDGVLYIDNKAIIQFDEIKKINALTYDKNEKYIRIYLTNPEKYIDSKNNTIQKFILKSNYRKFGSPILINSTFYRENSKKITDKILKMKNYWQQCL